MLPKDPIILLSYINTQLRDNYPNLDSLRDGLDIAQDEFDDMIKSLKAAGFSYNAENNSFS